ncbi:MAG: site-specific integrase [Nitrosomonadales bacterium]|nr:site-specific integrase [Nitrosomonadales bacterium]
MGSIRKREDNGLLFMDFRYKGARFREQTALAENSANRKRLEKVMDTIEADISAGIFDYRRYFPSSKNVSKFDELNGAPANDPVAANVAQVVAPVINGDVPLFRYFTETWFTEKEVEWRKSHRISTRADIDKLLIPHFGEKVVSQITKADILGFRAALSKVNARGKTTPLSARRINKIFGPLRQILNEAADRFDFRTPFHNIKQLKFRKTDIKPFTLDEVRQIINTVRPDFKNYYTVRFFTGMRTGEADGLKWKYVDFERRLILVRETVVAGDEEYTKNDGSQRDIQMSQVVYDALKEQEKSTRHLSPFVFCNSIGTPLAHKNITNRVWYPLLRHLDLEKRRPYQCRHTAATLWLASGENPEWIARQMGHTNTEMLFRVYSRFVPNLTRQDGSAFERLLLQSGATQPNQTEAQTKNMTEEISHE